MYSESMTKRITISVPDDVAERLEAAGPRQASSYVSQAVRQAAEREKTEQALEELFERFGRPSPAELDHARRLTDQAIAWQADQLRNRGSAT